MSLGAFLDQTATHERYTAAADASGGTTKTYATQTANVPCAVWPSKSRIAATFGRRDIESDVVLATATNLSAKAKDRFNVGGTYYHVVGVMPFANAAVSAETLYVHYCTLRTV